MLAQSLNTYSSEVLAILDAASPTLRKTVDKARLAFKNGHGSSSVHFLQIARSYTARKAAPCKTFDGLAMQYKSRIFVDTLYLKLAVSRIEKTENGKIKLPKEDREALQKLLPEHCSIQMVDHLSSTKKGQSQNNLYNNNPILILSVKSQNLALEEIWPIIESFGKKAWQQLSTGAYVGIWNFDVTLNFPGAVFPTVGTERKPIRVLGEKYVPFSNEQYNGFQCITWGQPDNGEWYDRYEAADYEEGGKTKARLKNPKRPQVKLYDKLVYILSTTSVLDKVSNNWGTLGWSAHQNIQVALRDSGIQTHGFGRLEIRFPGEQIPKSLEEVYDWMRASYNEVVPDYCHSETFLETLDWWFGKAVEQVAVVQKVDWGWNASIVRTGNTLTDKYNSESGWFAKREDVEYFLLCSKIAHMGLVIYWEEERIRHQYRQYYVGPTEVKPNLAFLDPAKYYVSGTRSKWAKSTLEEVGLAGGPFQITHRPIKADEKLKLLVHTDKQPDFTTTKQYERKMSDWVKRLKVGQRNMLAELQAYCGSVDWAEKVQAFAKTPKEGQLVGIRKGQRGWQFALLNRKGGTTTYQSNTALDSQMEELYKSKVYTKVPVYFSKGELSRTWQKDGKELEVYTDAHFVVPTNKDECAKYEPIRGQELLLWTRADYEECKGIKIW
jgi:hypothetical protein